MIYINDCGIVTALGSGKLANAEALFSAKSGLKRNGEFFTGEVKDGLPETFPELDCRNNRLMQMACAEIAPAVRAAIAKYGKDRIAVIVGTSTSGIADAEVLYANLLETGSWPEGYHYQQHEVSNLSTFTSRYFDVSGPCYTVATACSSSAKVFASARRLISSGFADAAIVGGCDTLCQMTLHGFNSLEILSSAHCQPFSRNRQGINIGEGAAVFLLSRDPGPVKLLGIGETSDAHHLTAPDPEGNGARIAMLQALTDAGFSANDIGYINLHGTATPLNDAMESQAVASIFGDRVLSSSTKGLTGHTLGAAGAVEAAFVWLTLNAQLNPENIVPAHLWDGNLDDELPALKLAKNGDAMTANFAALSNSFGFGGSNASLIFGRA